MAHRLDALDKKILELVIADARIPFLEVQTRSIQFTPIRRLRNRFGFWRADFCQHFTCKSCAGAL